MRTTKKTRRIATTTSATGAIRWTAAACVLTAAVLLSQPAGASGEALDEARSLMSSVAARYEGASAYEIDFRQESYWALADSTQVTSGTLSVVPPSHIAVLYDDGGSIVANGESLWVYVPQTNQFFAARLDSADVLVDPLRLLSGFEPSPDAPFAESEGAPGRRAVLLRPRPPAVEPVRLVVEIDVEARLVSALKARSSAGDRTHYVLTETRLGVSVPDSVFSPDPPPGAEKIIGTPYGG